MILEFCILKQYHHVLDESDLEMERAILKVAKFGGSSLASGTQLRKVLDIVKGDKNRKIIVVSAPGKGCRDDIKVTDLLIQYGVKFLSGEDYSDVQRKIIQRYQQIIDELEITGNISDAIQSDIEKLTHQEKNNDARVMDAFKAAGENNNAKLVAAFFSQYGVPSRYLNPQEAGIIVSDEPGNAQILEKSYDNLYQLRNTQEVLVIPGFFGYTEQGKICTFSRGGSDITGAIVASGVKADLYENFTDVDAIFAASPGVVENPKPIHELTYREMRELSYAGFSVFHDEALMPAFLSDIPIQIKNTNNPQAEGTKIIRSRELDGTDPVIGIASDACFVNLYLSKLLMNREVGFVRKVLSILEEYRIRFEHMPSGIDDVSVILREQQMSPKIEAEILRRLKDELEVDDVRISHDFSIIMIVGEGMKSCVGVASEATKAIADEGITLEMINQGSSEVSIMFGIKKDDEKKAVRALYKAFLA